MSRATQSLLFSVIYFIYLVVVMGPVQWLVIRPLCALMPSRRPAIVRGWLRSQARLVLGLARRLGGLRLHIRGAIPEASCIVLMNHQSLLDIPVGVRLITGPHPFIPTRVRYAHGFPGVSGLVRMLGGPFLSQGDRARRAELQAMTAAADAVGRGERSFLIYPEGHRSRTGELQPFMTPGLKLVFRRAAQRPVYLVVIDGLWKLRSVADIALRLAGHTARAEVRGPYAIPPDPRDHEAFIASLRTEMLTVLEGLRAPDPKSAPLAPRPRVG
ncbi:MAG: lysophospholipid acyltransferase family protein [Candidatus Eisenbacteria bacterium]